MEGGISFGGVVSFIFADLITLPLLLIYRKQYGRRMTLRILAVFWTVMSAAGLVTEYLFKALGWVPGTRPTVIAGDTLGFNYTTVLDVAALTVFAGLYRLYRNRERFGGGAGYAKDPVCGMQVEIATAPASLEHDGQRVHFCSEHCRDRFTKNPGRHLAPAGTANDEPSSPGDASAQVTDPVCGMTVVPGSAAPHHSFDGADFWFCSAGCAAAFEADPSTFIPAGRPH